MQQRYLEVTFRRGKALAAYYYLPRRTGDKGARVERHGPGMVVDLSTDGRPLGVEIAIPALVTVDAMNAVLKSYGVPPIDAIELAPLGRAA